MAAVTEVAAGDDVWAGDAVALAAIARNRVVHPACMPVPTELSAVERVVGLVVDDEQGSMAAHRPLPLASWSMAKEDGWAPPNVPGNLPSFMAAISSNERPERIVAATSFLLSSGLGEHCTILPGRQATETELLRAHTAEHVQAMLGLGKAVRCVDSAAAALAILNVSTAFNTVFMNEHSVNAALFAAGGSIEAATRVVAGDVQSAVCIVRPPGHHSECGCAMGFGLFNSVACAASHATAPIDDGGLGLERVLIVDWDIHHGNGTQSIFAEDESVLYFSVHSLHRYPAFTTDNWEEHMGPSFVGGGTADGTHNAAAGKSVNCAWSGEGYGDGEYRLLWERLLLPIAREFSPQLVIVSAGFDSAAGDEEGFQVTPRGYAHLIDELQQLAGGRVVVVLEGGYNIPAIANGLHACVAALSGAFTEAKGDDDGEAHRQQERQGDPPPQASAVADIDRTIDAQRPYWSCLRC